MLEMPTIDKTEEWEDRLDQGQGVVKFPVTLFDQLEVIDTNFEFPEVKVNTPKLKKNSVKEINLGKKPKNKGKELF
jgi:hypothetical protein